MKKNNATAFVFPGKFRFHEDAGHGWLEVPYQALEELKIVEAITECSYIKRDRVYLEEDLDTLTFIEAWLQYHGNRRADYKVFFEKMETVWDGDCSKIRTYRHYLPR
ncbi:MAG: hypothetical protein P4L51_01785 [Puia sp.]|nr:hypothetical protein [Puia sp.]